MEKTHQDLTAKGVSVSPIDHQAYGKFVQLQDVDGNGLMLFESIQ